MNKRKRLNTHWVQKQSKRIHQRLIKTKEFRQAKTIMFYLAKGNEVATAASIELALKRKKQVCAPWTNKKRKTICSIGIRNIQNDLCPGNYGILEPRKKGKRVINPKKIDLIIVPGTAFDLARNRLGRGLAYYDRFLAQAGKRIKIGLAFDFQIIPRLPTQRHDIALDKIITERRII